MRRSCELNQEFRVEHPFVKFRLNTLYNSSFYGAVLWNFKSEEFQRIVNIWSNSVRMLWGLPTRTHIIFIEPLGGIHAKAAIYSSFIRFTKHLNRSKKLGVLSLAHKTVSDMSSFTGSNARLVLQEFIPQNSIIDITKHIIAINTKQYKKQFKFAKCDLHDK